MIKPFASFAVIVGSAPKECNLLRHNEILHKDKCRIFEGKTVKLKCYLQPQQIIFNVATTTNEAAVQASVIISQITGKKSIPSMDIICEKEDTMKATEIFCPEKGQVFKSIILSANTVAERVNDMAEDT